ALRSQLLGEQAGICRLPAVAAVTRIDFQPSLERRQKDATHEAGHFIRTDGVFCIAGPRDEVLVRHPMSTINIDDILISHPIRQLFAPANDVEAVLLASPLTDDVASPFVGLR